MKNLSRLWTWIINERSNMVCVYRILDSNSLFLVIGVSFCFQMQIVYLSKERFISCFQGDRKEGQSVPLSLALLIQNNQYATEVHFGAACPRPQEYVCVSVYNRSCIESRRISVQTESGLFELICIKDVFLA